MIRFIILFCSFLVSQAHAVDGDFIFDHGKKIIWQRPLFEIRTRITESMGKSVLTVRLAPSVEKEVLARAETVKVYPDYQVKRMEYSFGSSVALYLSFQPEKPIFLNSYQGSSNEVVAQNNFVVMSGENKRKLQEAVKAGELLWIIPDSTKYYLYSRETQAKKYGIYDCPNQLENSLDMSELFILAKKFEEKLRLNDSLKSLETKDLMKGFFKDCFHPQMSAREQVFLLVPGQFQVTRSAIESMTIPSVLNPAQLIVQSMEQR